MMYMILIFYNKLLKYWGLFIYLEKIDHIFDAIHHGVGFYPHMDSESHFWMLMHFKCQHDGHWSLLCSFIVEYLILYWFIEMYVKYLKPRTEVQ